MSKQINALTKTLIGNQYPFFLNNQTLGEYYLYQINTPCLSPSIIPYISMTKISERTEGGFPWGNDSDIISAALGFRKPIAPDYAARFIENMMKDESLVVVKNGKNFPLIELTNDIIMQKALLLGLRQALRRRVYNFNPGSYIDILWTSKEFALFKIEGNQKEIWLSPVSVWRNTDVCLKNPLTIDWDRFDYPHEKFTNIQDFCKFIKKLEWFSFDKRPYKVDYQKK